MRLRGALLGAGNIALRGHAPQWTRDPRLCAEAEIVAVADLSASNLEAARALFPQARLYREAQELLEREELDFCDICTPPFNHRSLVEAAAERGLDILCEKPLAFDVADAEAIAASVKAAGVVFQPCHQYHFSPHWQTVRSWLPRIGRIYLAEHEVDRTAANLGSAHWSPAWRTDPKLAGGGIIFDHGAHIFYQLRSILGEPESIQAVARTLGHSAYEVDDSAFVVLDHGQCLAQVRLTWAARRRAIRFRFIGDAGEITGDEESVRIDAETREEARFDGGLSQNSSHSEWYAPLLQEFLARARLKDHSTEGLDEAVYVTRVIQLAYESSRQGRVISLADPLLARRGDAYALESSAPADLVTDDEALMAAEVRSQPAGARVGRWGLRLGALAATVAASFWAFHDIDWPDLIAALGAARAPWIALAIGVNFAVLYTQAWRWFALMRPLSPRVTMRDTFQAVIVGFAVSTVIPARAGELARVEWLGRRANLPRLSVLSSVVLDHLVNALGLLAGVAALPMLVADPRWLAPGAWALLALFVLASLGVFALRPRPGDPRDVMRLAAGAISQSGLRRFLMQLRTGLAAVQSRKALAASVSMSFVSWALEVNVVLISLRAVGLRLPLAASFLVLLAVNLALAIPLAPPGNIGTLELAATFALERFGVAKEQALAFGLCYHFLQVVPIMILGAFFANRSAARDRRAPAAA